MGCVWLFGYVFANWLFVARCKIDPGFLFFARLFWAITAPWKKQLYSAAIVFAYSCVLAIHVFIDNKNFSCAVVWCIINEVVAATKHVWSQPQKGFITILDGNIIRHVCVDSCPMSCGHLKESFTVPLPWHWFLYLPASQRHPVSARPERNNGSTRRRWIPQAT